MLKLTAIIYVEPHDPEKDPDDIVTRMNLGLESQLRGFPDGEIVQAKVEDAAIASQQELEDEGLVE